MGWRHRRDAIGRCRRMPAGQKHWHGASPDASMTHLAVTEYRDGAAVDWMEKVSDERYNGLRLRGRGRARTSDSANAAPISARIEPGAARLRPTVGTSAAADRDRPGDAHRRRAVRRRVATVRVVATRSQPPDRLGVDRDGETGAAWRPVRSRSQRWSTAKRGLWPSGAPGDLLRLARRGLGARGLRAGLRRPEDRDRSAAHRRLRVCPLPALTPPAPRPWMMN